MYNTKDHEKLQTDIDTLQGWSEEWSLYFHPSKCKVLHIGKNKPKCDCAPAVRGETATIYKCNDEKDLNVTFDKCLTLEIYIQKAMGQVNKMLEIIKRTVTCLNKETF